MSDKAFAITPAAHGRVAHGVKLSGSAGGGEGSIIDEFSALIGDLVVGTALADSNASDVTLEDPRMRAAVTTAIRTQGGGDDSAGDASITADAVGAGAIGSGLILPPLPTEGQAKSSDATLLADSMDGPAPLARSGQGNAAGAAGGDMAPGVQRRTQDMPAGQQAGPPAGAKSDAVANMNLPVASLADGDTAAQTLANAANPAAASGGVVVVAGNTETHRRPVLKVDFNTARKGEEPTARSGGAMHASARAAEEANKAIEAAARAEGDRSRSQDDRSRGRELKTTLMPDAAAAKAGAGSATVVSPMDANGIAKVITDAAQRLARGEDVAAPVRLPSDFPGQETMPLKRLHLQLQSDGGGTVGLRMALSDDGMQIRMATSDSEMARVLNGERDRLMTRLEDSGYHVLDLKVDHVESNDMRFSADGGAPRQSGSETPGRGRPDAQQQTGSEFMRAEEGSDASEPEQTGSARGRGIYV